MQFSTRKVAGIISFSYICRRKVLSALHFLTKIESIGIFAPMGEILPTMSARLFRLAFRTEPETLLFDRLHVDGDMGIAFQFLLYQGCALVDLS